ncbi:dephospho-CoA kinase [Clostridium sp. OM07-10AC]|nr:dephospho-CoA kinase [Clostridium sp. OM07-10AC]
MWQGKENDMYVIGLTGGVGSGKSLAARCWQRKEMLSF